MELARKRHKIRLLQQRKQRTEDAASFKDLPDDIPLQLTIGARVTARYVQGEHSDCAKPPVDIKTQVPF